MASFNQLTLMGYLGKKPEIRFMPNGTRVAKFSMATNEVWKDKNGEKKESTDWHYVEFIGPIAEVVEEYLDKGSFVLVQGKLRSERWTDKDGRERYGFKVHANTLKMLEGKRSGDQLEHDDSDSDDVPEWVTLADA